ncbi:MAG: SEA (Seh1-associated) complex subunit, partial [Candelina submexicana]
MSRFTGPSAAPPPIPPAPPLPPQRYAYRATNALARFAQPFIYGSRPPSAQGNRVEDLRGKAAPTSVPRTSSPLSSQTTTHKTGIPIAALDVSPQRTHVVLAGREILKTVRVSGATCAEEFNLRSEIIAYASTHTSIEDTSAIRQRRQLAADDVKWSHGSYDSTIVTATANGKIVVYDIKRPGVELVRLHEHSRQVHRVAINPHQGALVLSGSQDTSVRLWDLRTVAGGRGVTPPRSRYRYLGNAEGIRDLRWSPTDGVEFAFCTDGGIIQRWDFRKDNVPLLKINAHGKACQSICWHADGKHLVSAGSDKYVKVWDFSSTNRRQKPVRQFRAPQAVFNVRWRPPCWSAPMQGTGAWECTHLATSYNQKDPRIHLWDLRRPHVPYREFDRYHSPPTDMLWHSPNILWTVGMDGIFTQTDVHFAPKVLDQRSLQAFDWAPDGNITFFSQKRSPIRAPYFEQSNTGAVTRNNKVRATNGELVDRRRSGIDDGIDESFLSSSFKRHHGRSLSMKSSKSQGSTPPNPENTMAVKNLEESIREKHFYRPAQVAARGRVSGIFDSDVFAYLAYGYDASSLSFPDRQMQQKHPHLHQRVHKVFKKNAKHAYRVGYFRRSQSWKILGLAITRELHNTIEEDRRARLENEAQATLTAIQPINTKIDRMESNVSDNTRLHPAVRALGAPEGKAIDTRPESSSNMTTPQARPREDQADIHSAEMELLGQDDESALHSTSVINSDNINDSTAKDSGSPMTAGSQRTSSTLSLLDTSPEAIQLRGGAPAWRAQPKPVLTLDPPEQVSSPETSGGNVGRDTRHDSNESFFMFSASTDSSHGARSLAGSLEENKRSQGSDSAPERWSMSDRGAVSSQGSSDHHSVNQSSRSESENHLPEKGAFPERSDNDNDNDEHMLTSGTIVPSEGIERGEMSPTFQPGDVGEHDHTAPIDISITAASLNDPPTLPSASEPAILTPSHSDTSLTKLQIDLTTSSTPWSTIALIQNFIDFQTITLSDFQTPSILILLLSSLNLKNPVIPHAHSEAILTTYHSQLVALKLHNPAVQLRRLCVPLYPSIYEPALINTYLAFQCSNCKTPLEPNPALDRPPRFCERCQITLFPCSVCRRPKPDENEIWAWCQRCGHGGHATCLEEWWENDDSGGE